MKQITIDRAILLTPKRQQACGLDAGRLYHEESGYMCCLGIILHDAGIPRSMLNDRCMPNQVLPNPKVPKWMQLKDLERSPNSRTVNRLAEVNDNEHLTDDEREEAIAGALCKVGIEPIFVGEY